MPIDLNSFFSKPLNTAESSNVGFQPGYVSSNMDLLLQQARRNKSVREARLFDYIQVENDPHFSRSAEQNEIKLQKLLSNVALSQSLVTMTNSTLDMAGVQEFLPANIRDLMLNFNAIADTNSNSLLNIQQQLPFKQITDAFFSDLSLQFNGKTVTFGQVALMADRVLTNNDSFSDVTNNGLRPLLSLDLQQFLPNDMLGVLDTLNYIDTLTEIFGEDAPEIDTVNQIFTDNLTPYKSTPIDEIVDEDRYRAPLITLDDPLAIGIQSSFGNDIKEDYESKIDETLEIISQTVTITNSELNEIKAIFIEDVDSNLKEALGGKVGLPSLKECSTAVVNESHNKTIGAISLAFDKFARSLIQQLGVVNPGQNVRPIDQLLNMKRHLKSRLDMPKMGATAEEITAVQETLKTLLVNKDMSETRLLKLNKTVEEILNEQVEVC